MHLHFRPFKKRPQSEPGCRRQVPIEMGEGLHQLIGIDNCERTFCHDDLVRGNPCHQKYVSPDDVASNNLAASVEGCQKPEPFGCN